MRFLHTSDWHLGRILEQYHLTEDQAFVLDQFVALAKDRKPDAVLISGDVYDRGVPPPEAVELLDDVLSRLVRGLGVPVIVIAGNHDSRQRLGFGSKIMESGKLFIFGRATPKVPFVELKDAHGPVRFYALPYAEPSEWRLALKDDGVREHQDGFGRYVADIRAEHPKGTRSVLLAHCFATGGTASESERPLTLGGGGQVDAALFDSFDYAALGHLHRPQKAGKGWYSGSLLKYSKSEANQNKSVTFVEMDAAGACRLEQVSLRPKLDLRVIQGSFAELERGAASTDYIHAVYTDKERVPDVINRLRRIYPNIMGVERAEKELPAAGRIAVDEMLKMGDEELFRRFFEHTTGREPTPVQLRVFREAAQAAQGGEEGAR